MNKRNVIETEGLLLPSISTLNKRIGPKVKQVWNVAMHVVHNYFGFDINTTAYHLDRYNLYLLILKSSMSKFISFRLFEKQLFDEGTNTIP